MNLTRLKVQLKRLVISPVPQQRQIIIARCLNQSEALAQFASSAHKQPNKAIWACQDSPMKSVNGSNGVGGNGGAVRRARAYTITERVSRRLAQQGMMDGATSTNHLASCIVPHEHPLWPHSANLRTLNLRPPPPYPPSFNLFLLAQVRSNEHC